MLIFGIQFSDSGLIDIFLSTDVDIKPVTRIKTVGQATAYEYWFFLYRTPHTPILDWFERTSYTAPAPQPSRPKKISPSSFW